MKMRALIKGDLGQMTQRRQIAQWAGGRGRIPKNDEKVKVLGMELSIVESLSGIRGNIFTLF